jgi:Zinc carboxypeptidase
MSTRRVRTWRAAVLLPLVFAAAAQAQGHITTPKEQFGHNIGDDYFLATYDQFVDYWHKIDKESNRMQVIEMGKSSEGRPQLAAIITAPENFKLLQRYKDISMKLAKGEGLTDAQAKALAKEGKAVVWFDGGLHATEVLGAAQLMETTYQLVSRTDEETQRILKDDIILAVHANPDGMQLVSGWYMQEKDTLRRNTNIPRLYNKYAGHDDNRDSYMSNLAETRNINHLMFWDWHPQIMYNHHQTGPAGTVMFSPPFRDPFNYNFDPMIVMGLDMVGAAIHHRLLEENKPGFTMRSGSNYSTWWNGGLRTIGYFQGIIGILTETIGSPTPTRIPFIADQQLPRGDLPAPIAPQEWHFRQSVDYSVSANYAIFDLASRYRETLLYDKYLMAKNAIAKGNTDSWTVTGDRIAEASAALSAGATQQGAGGRGGRGGRGAAAAGAPPAGGFGGRANDAASLKVFNDVLRAKDKRDPRGYIVTADQADFPTATRFINSLRHVGVFVDRATRAFAVNGKQYPAGSYVIKTAQAARAHVMDMFEPQDHPNDFAYPGGPPRRPYDNAGWTLAYQMGVQFDRVLDAFDAPTQRIEGLAKPAAGTIGGQQGAAGYLLSASYNDAATVINRAFKANADVYALRSPLQANGRSYPSGSYYIAAAGLPVVQKAAAELGVSFDGTSARPGSDAVKLAAKRIALIDRYGGSMPSGWTRLEFENFEIPYDVVYPQQIDAGDLKAKYDVIIFPSDIRLTGGNQGNGAGGRGGRGGGGGGGGGGNAATIPAEYQKMLGQLTAERSLPALTTFIEDGGTIIASGGATAIGYQLGLPIENHLVMRTPGEPDRALSGEEYYVPGSILRVAVDTKDPATSGMSSQIDVFFDNDPVFRLKPDAAMKGVRAIAWFDNATPLRSGWAWGQNYLEGGTAALEATIGKGKVYLFSPEITFRGQPHGTFKFLFNGIYQ